MKKLTITTVFLLLAAGVTFSQATCTRHVETAGGFSYCPPPDWTSKDPRSGTYKTFVTAAGAPARANFNLKTEPVTIAHDAYMASALRLLLSGNEAKGEAATKLIGWTTFITDSKLQGSRAVYETLYEGSLLRTVQFVLDFPEKKLILTGTSLASDKQGTDKIFEAVAKTIRIAR